VDLLNWVLTLYGWYVALMIALGFFVGLVLWFVSPARHWRKTVPGEKWGG
jgi:hypothetical protein